MSDSSEAVCPTCGRDDFVSMQYVRVHHTQTHGERIPETMECEMCGDEFEILPSERDERRTCSMECRTSLHEKEGALTGESNPAWKALIQKDCRWCQNEFEVRPSRTDRIHFCSDKCRSDWRSEWASGKSSPVWNGGDETVVCSFCNDQYSIRPSKAESSSFCSRRCLADWMAENKSGKNSYRWNGGHARNYGKLWNRHRRIIAEYYSNCQACEGEGRDVHHIIPYKRFDSDKKANSLTNLIYLCRDCHAKVEIDKKENPEPDSVSEILTGVGEICHDECLTRAEDPTAVIDEIDRFEPV